jgi:hypothetical protein
LVPSQAPAQVPVPEQSGRVPIGWVPAGVAEQVPTLPATLQASHRPEHLELQQTPSVHDRPLWHWLSLVQAAP